MGPDKSHGFQVGGKILQHPCGENFSTIGKMDISIVTPGFQSYDFSWLKEKSAFRSGHRESEGGI
jgi:hypothetical protein